MDEEFELRVRAAPGALGLLRASDARLEAFKQAARPQRRNRHLVFREFQQPDAYSMHTSFLTGLLDVHALKGAISEWSSPLR